MVAFCRSLISCLLIFLTSSSLQAQDQGGSGLANELAHLIATRRKAIRSIEASAEFLSVSAELLNPFDTNQLKKVLADYAESGRSAADRKRLYETLVQKPAVPLVVIPIKLYEDDTRYSLFMEGKHRYVTDHRAGIRTTMLGAVAPAAQIYPRTGSLRPIDLRDFSREFKLKSDTPSQVVADDKGQFLVSGTAEPSTTWTRAISLEDGILASSLTESPDRRWLTIQTGRISTRSQVPFPAVICEIRYKGGSPDGLMLLVPIEIRVNEPLPAEVFKVAMPAGATITDNRDPGHPPRAASKDVDDIVELADALSGTKPDSKRSAK